MKFSSYDGISEKAIKLSFITESSVYLRNCLIIFTLLDEQLNFTYVLLTYIFAYL
jgi:hypothetical protein